jgi:hypothetical protein
MTMSGRPTFFMVKGAIHVLMLLLGYFASWTAAYLGMMLLRGSGFNFDHYFEYFYLAWTFNAFEVPTFIWFGSLVLYCPVAVGCVRMVNRCLTFKTT